MKIFFDIILGSIIIITMLAIGLLVINLIIMLIFIIFDFNKVMGALSAIIFLVLFSIAGGLAKTREYFPGMQQLLRKK